MRQAIAVSYPGTKAAADAPILSASISLAIITPGEESDTHALLLATDVTLDQAQHEGRNQAVYFPVDDGSFLNCANLSA